MKSRYFLPLIVLIATRLPLMEARAELVTLFFTEGEPRTVELIRADQAQLFWKLAATDSEVQTTLRSQLDRVLFPPSDGWSRAELAREAGNLEEALKLYYEVIADPAGNYFPFPGNFVSLSKERILQIYRLGLDAESIAKQARVVREEFFHLPPEYRRVEPETAAWSAIANKTWDKALLALDEQKAPTAETFYLKGLALEALGRKSEAVTEYAGAYVLNFGGSLLLTQTALQRSSKLVFEINDPDRKAELQAQVKLYRDLYGKGKLWEGAPEMLVSLADGEIKPLGTASANMEKPVKSTAMSDGFVAEDPATLATLPSKEERDYVLPEELTEKILVLGPTGKTLPLKLEGGVTKEDDSFRFDGTGGYVKLEPFSAKETFVKIHLSFVSEAMDGILCQFGSGASGGFSIYLKGGEIVIDWAPSGAKLITAVIGKVVPNEVMNLSVRVDDSGERTVYFKGQKTVVAKVPAGGLKIAQTGGIHIGDSEGGGGTLSGEKLPPFRGQIRHFSIGTATSLSTLNQLDIESFGKKFLFQPPANSPK